MTRQEFRVQCREAGIPPVDDRLVARLGYQAEWEGLDWYNLHSDTWPGLPDGQEHTALHLLQARYQAILAEGTRCMVCGTGLAGRQVMGASLGRTCDGDGCYDRAS